MLSTIWMAKRIKCVQISKHNTVYLILPASLTLSPPHEKCTNPDCRRVNVLKKAEFRQVVVYSMSRGACRAWSVHLFCPGKNLYVRLKCSNRYYSTFEQNAVQTITTTMLFGMGCATTMEICQSICKLENINLQKIN